MKKMKKIKKVWPAYLKTDPVETQRNSAKSIIAEPYNDFHDAYLHGVESFKYEHWQIVWLINVFDCELWELFEDIEKPTEDIQNQDDNHEDSSRYVGKSGMQVFDVIDEFGLDYYEGNALKYLIRYKKKNGLEDLKKCRDYLDYLIEGYME